jgi:hypothetical protein
MTVETIASELRGRPWGIAVDATHIYSVLDTAPDDGIVRVTKTGGTPSRTGLPRTLVTVGIGPKLALHSFGNGLRRRPIYMRREPIQPEGLDGASLIDAGLEVQEFVLEHFAVAWFGFDLCAATCGKRYRRKLQNHVGGAGNSRLHEEEL